MDKNVYLWDTVRTQQMAVLKGHTGEPVVLGFSHGGDLLASRGWDGLLKLWDAQSGKELLSWQHGNESLQFSSDDRWLSPALIGDGTRSFALVEVAKGHECRILGSHTDYLGSADFSPDGKLLATSGRDGVRLWDMTKYREVAFQRAPRSATVIFERDGHSLLTSGGGGLRRWQVRREHTNDTQRTNIGPPENLVKLTEHEGAALSADGKRVAIGQAGSGVRLFDLGQPSQEVALFKHPNNGAAFGCFSPDGKWLATSTWHGRGVKVWEVDTGRLVRDVIDEAESRASFSPDGRWLVTSTGTEYRFWEARSWQPRHAVARQGAGKTAGPTAFSPDGRLLALTPGLRGVRLVETSTGRELAVLDTDNQFPMCFSPDGCKLVTADIVNTVRVWDLSLIRPQLAAMKLDWTDSPSSTAGTQ